MINLPIIKLAALAVNTAKSMKISGLILISKAHIMSFVRFLSLYLIILNKSNKKANTI